MRRLSPTVRVLALFLALASLAATPASAAISTGSETAGISAARGPSHALPDGLMAISLLGVGIVAAAEKLYKERAALIDQAKKILDKASAEKRDLTAEEDAEFDRLHADANKKRDEADALQAAHDKNEERHRRQNEAEDQLATLNTHGINLQNHRGSAAGANPQDRAREGDWPLAIQGWFINQSDYGIGLRAEHTEAAQRVGLNLQARLLSLPLNQNYNAVRRDYFNSLGTQTGGGGGNLVQPESLVSVLEMAMLQFGGMLRVSEVMRTATGAPMPWPTVNDTSNSGRQIGENAAVSSATDPTFKQQTWNAYKFTSDEILVSFELLRDSPFNLVQVIGALLGERLGRIQNTKFTVGNGAGTCWGIVNRATTGKTAASATAIAADELLDLQHSVDIAYRSGAGVGWMMHDNIALALRKLKNGDGSYLWVEGLQPGQPAQLLGNAVTINNDMASSIASSGKSILYGALNYYKVRQVGAVRIYRLTERHRENDQDAFLAFVEADGNLLDAGTHPVKVLVQA